MDFWLNLVPWSQGLKLCQSYWFILVHGSKGVLYHGTRCMLMVEAKDKRDFWTINRSCRKESNRWAGCEAISEDFGGIHELESLVDHGGSSRKILPHRPSCWVMLEAWEYTTDISCKQHFSASCICMKNRGSYWSRNHFNIHGVFVVLFHSISGTTEVALSLQVTNSASNMNFWDTWTADFLYHQRRKTIDVEGPKDP